MRTIKFRGRDINGNFVYGFLTKKKIRSSGEIRYAIATGNCTAGETIPVNENSIAQLVGVDANGNEVYEDDTIITPDGKEWCAKLFEVVTDDETYKRISIIGIDLIFTLKEASK